MKTYEYYTIKALAPDGTEETLFQTYDKSDARYELDANKEGWKHEGYKQIKLSSEQREESPDEEVYGIITDIDLVREKVEAVYKKHVEGNEMTCEGENIESDVYAIERDEEDFNVVTVSFGDEYMMEPISGNVSCSIYDAIEKDLSDLGFEIIETD